MYMQLAHAEREKQTRAFYLINARTNIDYVIRNWTPEAGLFREAHVRKGLLLGETGEALEAIPLYQKVIQLDPNYVPAYAALGDLLAKLGEKQQAKEVLEQGLSKVPQSKLLNSRLRKLGK
jgi:tetratricopeptide (TPR) repeat protein